MKGRVRSKGRNPRSEPALASGLLKLTLKKSLGANFQKILANGSDFDGHRGIRAVEENYKALIFDQTLDQAKVWGNGNVWDLPSPIMEIASLMLAKTFPFVFRIIQLLRHSEAVALAEAAAISLLRL